MKDRGLIKHAGGRPTKYNPDVIYPKIEEYLSMCSREQTKLPSVEGLALFLDVNKTTLFAWDKIYPEFSNYLKKLADTQKQQLMNDGMYGGKEVNAGMAIFLLKAIHGLKDGSGTNVNVSGDKVIAILGGVTKDVHTDDSNKEDTPTD
jgi:hypothetical protein